MFGSGLTTLIASNNERMIMRIFKSLEGADLLI